MPYNEDELDLRIENLAGGFRNYGYRVAGQPVSERKQELLEELRKAMRNADYIFERAHGNREQKLKVLHERLPEPCFGVML